MATAASLGIAGVATHFPLPTSDPIDSMLRPHASELSLVTIGGQLGF